MKFLRFLPGASVLLTSVSCTTVKPWERGKLADYLMKPARDPLTDSISEHVWFTREAFAGVGGGGFGSN